MVAYKPLAVKSVANPLTVPLAELLIDPLANSRAAKHSPSKHGGRRLRPGREGGVALVTSLILLLLLTILALSGSGSALVETRLANNLKFRQQAREMAEYALRQAEANLQAAALVNRSDAFIAQFDPASATHALGFDSAILRNSPALTFGPQSAVIFDSGAAANRLLWSNLNSVLVTSDDYQLTGRYTVEYLGRVGLPPADKEDVDRRQYAFRITAIGYSLAGAPTATAPAAASYLLQTTFAQPLF